MNDKKVKKAAKAALYKYAYRLLELEGNIGEIAKVEEHDFEKNYWLPPVST